MERPPDRARRATGRTGDGGTAGHGDATWHGGAAGDGDATWHGGAAGDGPRGCAGSIASSSLGQLNSPTKFQSPSRASEKEVRYFFLGKG